MTIELPPVRHGYDVEVLEEPKALVLRVVVAALDVVGEPQDSPLPDSRPISSGPASPRFELIWENYIAYAVLNESYAEPIAGVTSGALQRVPSSPFLDYVSAATFASDDHPGPFEHYQLCCAWHVVDVASTDPPKITRLKPATSLN